MTSGGVCGKSYSIVAEDGWDALDLAQPMAEADGYEVLDGTDLVSTKGVFALIVKGDEK